MKNGSSSLCSPKAIIITSRYFLRTQRPLERMNKELKDQPLK